MAAHSLACTTLLVRMNEPGRWAGICREQAALSHDPLVRDLLLEMAAEYEAVAAGVGDDSAAADPPESVDAAAGHHLNG